MVQSSYNIFLGGFHGCVTCRRSRRGLGSAVSEFLAKQDIRVFSCDIKEQSSVNKNVVPIYIDVTDPASIKKAFEIVSSETSKIFAIITIAGVFSMDSIVEIPEDKFNNILEINLSGVYRVNKTFLPLLEKGGRIIVTTSEVANLRPYPFSGMYCMTKTALERYADTLRLELQLIGIKVINIKPGPFKTDMLACTNSEAEKLVENTELFKVGTKRFVSVINSKKGAAKDPSVLAQVYYKALTAKHPKFTYYKNAGLGLKVFSRLPRRLQAALIRLVLRENKRSNSNDCFL